MYRILVTGTRNGWPAEHLAEVITDHFWTVDERSYHGAVLVHGGANGVDSQVEQYGKTFGMSTEVHPANWKQYGKSAGPRRNAEMVALGADVCFAFIGLNSVGTLGCARMAADAGITVHWFHENGTFGHYRDGQPSEQ